MKKLFISIACFLFLSAVSAQQNTDRETVRSLNGSFTAIQVSGGIDLYLTQGSEETVAVSASDQKYIDRIKTELVNGTLKIYYDSKGVSWRSDARKLKAYVTFKTLEKLHASAGSGVTVNGSITAGKLDLKVSSGAQLNGDIKATEISAGVSSGAGIKITGKADKLTVDASSGADFKGYDFAVDYCDASASSGAAVHITINKELSAKVSGGADIRYKGTALIRDIKTSGGGSIKKA